MRYEGVVHTEGFMDCPFSIAQDYVEDYLRNAEHDKKGAVIYAGPFRRRVVFQFGTRNDATEPGRPHDEIVLSWSAKTSLLPNLHGTLRMRISMPGTLLVLDGRYVPPGGALGAFFDRLVGSRIAGTTGEALIAGIAARANTSCNSTERFARRVE